MGRKKIVPGQMPKIPVPYYRTSPKCKKNHEILTTKCFAKYCQRLISQVKNVSN